LDKASAAPVEIVCVLILPHKKRLIRNNISSLYQDCAQIQAYTVAIHFFCLGLGYKKVDIINFKGVRSMKFIKFGICTSSKHIYRSAFALPIIMLFLNNVPSRTIEGISAVVTDNAPKAIGPYSQAVRTDNYVFVSGQVGRDPATGTLRGDSTAEQTEQVLRNIGAILHAQGLTFEHVVKAEIYLMDMRDFHVVNGVYETYFPHAVKPARQTMQVAKLPLDALVEISCIAFIPTIHQK
jgi:2-iminobutanoate/2-iminopropanoate deaminase